MFMKFIMFMPSAGFPRFLVVAMNFKNIMNVVWTILSPVSGISGAGGLSFQDAAIAVHTGFVINADIHSDHS